MLVVLMRSEISRNEHKLISEYLQYSLLSVLDIMDTARLLSNQNEHPPIMMYLVDLSNMLVLANSALRIFVYYAFGRPFQQRLHSIFCSCCLVTTEATGSSSAIAKLVETAM